MTSWLEREVKLKTVLLVILPALIVAVVVVLVSWPGEKSDDPSTDSMDTIDDILASPDPPSRPAAPGPVLSYEEKLAECVPERDPGQKPDPLSADEAEAAGAHLYRVEDFEGASTAYERCLRLDPTRTECLRNLAVALSKSNRRARALACYSAYLETYSGPSEPPQLLNPGP